MAKQVEKSYYIASLLWIRDSFHLLYPNEYPIERPTHPPLPHPINRFIWRSIMKKYYYLAIPLVALLCFVLCLALWFALKPEKEVPQNLTYSSFLKAVEEKNVDHVILSDKKDTFKAYLKPNTSVPYLVPNPHTDHLTEYLLTNQVNVTYDKSGLLSASAQLGLLACLAFGIACFFFFRKRDHFSIHNYKKEEKKHDVITLNEVAGNEEAKAMAVDIIQFIKEPESYTSLGARMPKGLLLYGPPGTGKTLLAKAIAGEAQVPFYSMSGSDFVQMYVGVGASRIRNLFQKAKKSEKAVIFIDEIDAIGKKRGRDLSASNDERDQTLNALLTEMSGFHESKGIVVIAATNRYDMLDEALLRPGRFDRQIEVSLPDFNARKRILSYYAKKRPLSKEVDLTALSKSTLSFSGAMLENLLNEAAILAAKEKCSCIGQDHIEHAFYTVIAGAPKVDRSCITERERKITAYHEAGHTLATKLLLPEHTITKVTIVPSTQGAGGFHMSVPADTLYQTKRQIMARLQVLLAGRAAEEIIFGKEEITTGASNDIQKASSLLLHFLDHFGMDSDLGLFSMKAVEEKYDASLLNRCREQMKEAYDATLQLIEENRPMLETLTTALLEQETLNEKDILSLIA